MSFPGLQIEIKKGDPLRLHGKLIAYVRVEGREDANASPEESESASPLEGLVRNGVLAVQANYVDQRNIRDFFKKEFGISLEKGIEEVIEQARETGGLEGALDPEAVKERLESMKNADFIPIPAKVAFFSSEEEMLSQDADVYYLGSFTVLSHAHLCVNAFPILYQAYYREQEQREVEVEIAALLRTVEGKPKEAASQITDNATEADWKEHLLKGLIPRMIYTRGEADGHAEHEKAVAEFRSFMEEFGFPEDAEAIVALIESSPEFDAVALRKLELRVARVEALQREDYERLGGHRQAGIGRVVSPQKAFSAGHLDVLHALQPFARVRVNTFGELLHETGVNVPVHEDIRPAFLQKRARRGFVARQVTRLVAVVVA